ncbi:MAG TPA: glycosyltransferase [Candidatus Saccharimonadales bacterium]|nr:glycosyltransferase [Candidatus Saccharimonadales bacterium]
MSKRQMIAVVIPCHNEAAGIGQVIEKIPRSKLAQDGFDVTVYVVDNNSSDNTAQVAQDAGATVIVERQKGKGYALRAGFRALPKTVDYVVMLDGDDTYSSSELPRMVEPLQNQFCDVVVGTRLGGHICDNAMNTFNRLGNWFFTNAVRTLYRANVTDVLTGYFAWKKEALDIIYPHLTSSGFAIEMEMVTKMARLNLSMTSVPVSYHPRAGESNLRPVHDGSRILHMLMGNLFWRPKQISAIRKIVFVSDAIYPYFKGGKEKRLHELSKQLVRMGYDVHIYTMKWWKQPEKTRIEHGVKLHALCKHYEMYHGNRRTIREACMFSLACFRLFRVRFDVLDVDHMPFFPILTTWIVCKLRRLRLYGTWHEALSSKDWTEYMGKSGYIAALIERMSVRLPHAITAASLHTKEKLANIHGRIDRVGLVASGLDLQLLEDIEPADTKTDILYVGRLVKDKNIDRLFDAVSIIAGRNPGVRCTIIGHGLEEQRLRKQAKKQGIADNVTFLKPLARAEDIYAYMKAARVFCLPSVREGFSIVTLEALGCGTPVVTTNAEANAARHLIEPNKNGSIVPCDPKHIAQALSFWIDQAGRVSIPEVTQYDWRNLAQDQVEIYNL